MSQQALPANPKGCCSPRTGLNALCPLTPGRRFGVRGRWAAKALPLVFAVLWLLALAGTLGS